MSKYTALIIDNVTGKRRHLSIGKAGNIHHACEIANEECPDGWTVLNVFER